MEVALRAMNLLAAFEPFLRPPQMNEVALKNLLKMLDQHGAHIQRNLEFSHIATSKHYLADVAGLLWIGVMLPELAAAQYWREFGLRELLHEMDQQVLADGADYEASTGYHRLKLELFLYSFVLCHLNGIDIAEKYWSNLRAMVEYVRAYLRPDGRAPLIGDSDSGQIRPIYMSGICFVRPLIIQRFKLTTLNKTVLKRQRRLLSAMKHGREYLIGSQAKRPIWSLLSIMVISGSHSQ